MKISKIANRHIIKHVSLLVLLKSKKRDNPRIMTLILCEIYFTNFFKRQLEYVAWILLTLINSKRRLRLSIGIGQVQVKHWIDHEFISDEILFQNLKQIINPLVNYDLVKEIVESELNYGSIKLLSKFRGEARLYHLKLFQAIENRLNLLDSQLLHLRQCVK